MTKKAKIHLRHPDCTYPNPFYGDAACNVLGVDNPQSRRVEVSRHGERVTCLRCLRIKKYYNRFQNDFSKFVTKIIQEMGIDKISRHFSLSKYAIERWAEGIVKPHPLMIPRLVREINKLENA